MLCFPLLTHHLVLDLVSDLVPTSVLALFSFVLLVLLVTLLYFTMEDSCPCLIRLLHNRSDPFLREHTYPSCLLLYVA